ncbi:MAG: DUF3332 family protein [Candidatus Omnitrophica bacterium]|nr:DUF3332 family protein [Candidatus Omnitrophota bacterium]
MITRRPARFSIALLALMLGVSGCYGPFHLTRRLHAWNGHAGSKWEQEFLFLLLVWAPVYGFTSLADALLFNSLEFWTGNNPVTPPRASGFMKIKRFTRADEEVVLTYLPTQDHARLEVQQFRNGRPVDELQVEQRDGMAVGSDAQGRVLLTAQTRADGGVVVRDAQGHPVASYSSSQVERLLASTRDVRR